MYEEEDVCEDSTGQDETKHDTTGQDGGWWWW